MGNLIHINFGNASDSYTLELYLENNAVHMERLLAKGMEEAKRKAFERARSINKVRFMKIYAVPPWKRKSSDQAALTLTNSNND